MSGKDDGVFVSRRIIIIVILVSLCVNVFFLMMGILIGKDDLKWQAGQEDKPHEQTTQVSENATTQDNLSKDLSLFEGDLADEDTRRPPIPEEAVKHDGSSAIQTDSASEPVETEPLTPPVEVESKPEPKREEPVKKDPPKTEAPKPEPAKVEKPKPEPPKVEPAKAGTFWIQVMAIADQDKAKEFLQKAKNKGYGGTMINEKGLWKVRLGPYNDRPTADKAKDQANAALGVGGWVIQK